MTLCNMAHPQRTIPTLIRMLVVMAEEDGNWRTVYKTTSATRVKSNVWQVKKRKRKEDYQ